MTLGTEVWEAIYAARTKMQASLKFLASFQESVNQAVKAVQP
jgi:hypothetical protein